MSYPSNISARWSEIIPKKWVPCTSKRPEYELLLGYKSSNTLKKHLGVTRFGCLLGLILIHGFCIHGIWYACVYTYAYIYIYIHIAAIDVDEDKYEISNDDDDDDDVDSWNRMECWFRDARGILRGDVDLFLWMALLAQSFQTLFALYCYLADNGWHMIRVIYHCCMLRCSFGYSAKDRSTSVRTFTREIRRIPQPAQGLRR